MQVVRQNTTASPIVYKLFSELGLQRRRTSDTPVNTLTIRAEPLLMHNRFDHSIQTIEINQMIYFSGIHR